MKNKNGFTLVELLAVIAILAILVIIALPNVMGMFNKSKEESFTTEIKQIYKVAENTWMSDSLFETSERVYTSCETCTGESLDLSGIKNIDYYIKINKAGKVVEYYVTDGNYQFEFNSGTLELTDIKDIKNISDLFEEDVILIADDEVTNAGEVVSLDPNTIPENGNYYNSNTGTFYETLKQAFDNINDNQKITVLKDTTETTGITLPNKNGIKLDLNGKTITMNSCCILNNGTLDIYNSSKTVGTITGGSYAIIRNTNVLTLNNTSSKNGIKIERTIITNQSSNVTGVIENPVSATLTINKNSVVTTDLRDSNGLLNYGTAVINDGTIYSRSDGIYNNKNLTINGGTISGYSNGINNHTKGSITISGGTIKSDTYIGLLNNGTVNMSNGNIYGKTQGFYNHYANTSDNNVIRGEATITGGTFSSDNQAIYVNNNSTLTLGVNDTKINTSKPIVQSTGTSSSNGVYVVSGGVFNYYDGIIKSASGTGKAISGTVSGKPNGYVIHKETSNGVESAYLVHE